MTRRRAVILSIVLLPWALAHGATVSVGTLVVEPGATVDIPVSVDQVSGLLGYFFTLEHTSDFAFVGASRGDLTGTWMEPVPHASGTEVTVAASGTNAVSGAGSIAVVRLQALAGAANGTTHPLTLTAVELNDGALSASSRNGQIVVSTTIVVAVPAETPVEPGQSIVVPITAHEAAGVQGYFLDLTYDDTLLQYNGWTAGGLSWGGPVVNDATGRIRVAESGDTVLAGTGDMIELHFTVLGGGGCGTYAAFDLEVELNDGGLASAASDGTLAVTDTSVVWADFAGPGGGTGYCGDSVATLAEAVALVPAGGTVHLVGGDSSETMVLTKAMRLEAGSLAHIGVAPTKAVAALPATKDDTGETTTGTGSSATDGVTTALASASDGTEADGTPFILPELAYQTVLPFTTDASGAHCLGGQDEMAIRLRSASTILPETISIVVVGLPADSYEPVWSPVTEGDATDLWARVLLRPGYELPGKLLVIATALDTTGTTIGPHAYTFTDTCNGQVETLQPIPQPEGTQAEIYALPADMLPEGVPPREHVYYIGPEEVFDTPQTIWLPASEEDSVEPEVLINWEGTIQWLPMARTQGYLTTEIEAVCHASESRITYNANHGAIVALVR